MRHGASWRSTRSTVHWKTKIASGKLLTLDNQIDTTTGTVKARAIFDNKDDALFPNQFVNTKLLVRTLKGIMLAPNECDPRDVASRTTGCEE
jgi:multidrug efflux pump subunit AcrA (membrane-fusion protein)